MSETEEEYGKSEMPQSLIEALLLPNRSVITWHDPEKEVPNRGVSYGYIVVTLYGRWHKATYDGGQWWWDISHTPISHVVLYGTFDLPELPEEVKP